MQEMTIKKNDSGQRVDRFLRKVLPNMPLSHIHRCIRTKRVKVNGKRVWGDTMLEEGDRLRIFVPRGDIIKEVQPDLSHLCQTKFFKDHFHVIHEDDAILALNKPAGIVVHPGSKYRTGQTLIDLARSHIGISDAATFQPSLVHRLDKDTSGVILIAKTASCLRAMTAMLRKATIRKEYLALVQGTLKKDKGEFGQPLLRVGDAEKGGKVKVNIPDGKQAQTSYQTVEKLPGYTLVRARLHTGRTHQIRVHFAANGHPIAGDTTYGDPSSTNPTGLGRQFLHADTVSFIHPSTGKRLRLHAPLPRDLKACLGLLRP